MLYVVQFLMFQEIFILLHSYIILLHFSPPFSLYFLFCFPLRNGPKPTPKMRYVYHPQGTPSSSYQEAAWAKTLEEQSSGMHSISVQDGLEVSAAAKWGHFSRQSGLASSSSTVWVLCNVRESSTTYIIFVSQRNSLPFCATVLPVYLPDITRALCHHHCVCRHLCVSAKCSSTSFCWNKLPHTVQALPYGPVWSRRPWQAFMLYWRIPAKCPMLFKGTSVYLQDSTETTIGAKSGSKKKLMYNKTTIKDSYCLPCWTDRHTVTVVTGLSLQAVVTVPLCWHKGASLKCCNWSCPLPWRVISWPDHMKCDG